MIRRDIVRPSDDQLSTLSNISPNDLGHYVDFGHAFGLDYMGMSDEVTLVGSALTVRIPPEDATMVHKATEIAKPGDVLVIDMQGHGTNACWGELTTHAAIASGVAGVVIDGSVTDTRDIAALDFPVYARERSTRTCRILGLGGEINGRVQIGSAVVNPGDALVGNEDGVLVLPQDRIDEAIDLCGDKKDREAERIERMKSGESLADQSGANDLIEERDLA
ncbi:RraA family protein [Haladaptatus sp. CMAA 1911]|uniref:RraA family protein n=1 Tax=unclassified Haladaptatus TaxID=2622732 RepID=UPI003753F952